MPRPRYTNLHKDAVQCFEEFFGLCLRKRLFFGKRSVSQLRIYISAALKLPNPALTCLEALIKALHSILGINPRRNSGLKSASRISIWASLNAKGKLFDVHPFT